MTPEEKWNLICEQFQKNRNAKEQVIQDLWENNFVELFGYSRLSNDIDIHRTIHLGAQDKLIPDIIIKNKSKDCFVVELKRFCSMDTSKIYQQLFSYLKQLEIELGILVCDKLCLINYSLGKQDSEPESIEINFTKDNPNGIRFLKLFSKENFSENAVKSFIREQAHTVAHIDRIKDEIKENLIMDLLKNYFSDKYTELEFNEAVKGLKLQVHFPQEPDLNHNSGEGSFSAQEHFQNKCERNEAIEICRQICRQKGINIPEKITYAAKNSNCNRYWANPNISLLQADWSLILDDWENKELHVFYIPANSLTNSMVRVRADKQELIDLQILYNNPNFKDTRSGICFAKYRIETQPY